MSKLKYLIPTVFLFASPWMHKLIYLNIMAAAPYVNDNDAHVIAIIGALVAFFVTLLWATAP